MSVTAAIVTIGDELLAGDVENTNASWLAAQLTDSGVDIREIRVVPDAIDEIAATVAELGERWTFVLTTGGLGSTPDDVTVDAVADALDRPLETHPEAREWIEAAVAEIRTSHPGFRHDVDAACRFPAGAQIIPNGEGIAPGCDCGNVYVLPGIPDEMKAVFRQVEDEFSGDVRSRTLYSDTPESHLNGLLNDVRDRFGVRVGCYPMEDRRRIRIASTDGDALSDAYGWLAAREEIEPPDGGDQPRGSTDSD